MEEGEEKITKGSKAPPAEFAGGGVAREAGALKQQRVLDRRLP
jgi:hypothetical protein